MCINPTRNLQLLAIEVFKAAKNSVPTIFYEIFQKMSKIFIISATQLNLRYHQLKRFRMD